MSETASPTLLPEGLRDVLPPDAAAEADLVERLTATFNANGYDRVSPPLVEFESTLLAGMGAATADRIFRMVDPISQRTLGIRADVTAQIARLASTRLQKAPRPLRLMYAGQVLRVKGHQLRPERQFTQVGFELVGPDSVAADAEAIIVAVQAVVGLGIKDITVDLALPPLVASLLESAGLSDDEADALYAALNHKDAAEIKKLGGTHADILSALIEASGPLKLARDVLGKIDLPAAAAAHLATLFAVADMVTSESPDIALTVDLVENRGLQYHTGVTFFLFAKGSTREIGRGGRYLINHSDDATEPATGATLFMDALLPVAPPPSSMSCIYVTYGTTRDAIRKLQNDGFRVRVSLSTDSDSLAEARGLGCSHMLQDGEVVDVPSEG
ncbi:MAG: ATP phosphoribosyltransferase regulatory subunit [Rhodospirillaceae bacterium]|jgi:ATP phosphoribosyltransferase regulatory subunit|nr:ATP phosphoribosyltransferase regulatory subunit [Rhodospirillaceae bacterium]MBT5564085.1 ATP phosphoribosyltransferase regulatory subunit [Rhodospirillaceae bacterium]MBT6089882.1 ATP phosphoribosyltransferase regulatory subunit [Rhodospirillaceae bacterium]MBT7451372.1 ATP phosphoribosyltransferase regulatory subunit [Rhodospirillaceae bacterium]